MRMLLAAVSVMALAACQGEEATATGSETPPADAAASDAATSAADPAPPAAAPAPGAKAADAAAFSKYVPWKSDQAEIQKPNGAGGIEYVVLASGPAGGAPPSASQQAEIFYEGRLNIGGPAFDSAFERNEAATFPVASVVPGFSQALQMMKPGDRWLVYIPSDLAYGPRGAGGRIPPNADLVFEIEMVSVQ